MFETGHCHVGAMRVVKHQANTKPGQQLNVVWATKCAVTVCSQVCATCHTNAWHAHTRHMPCLSCCHVMRMLPRIVTTAPHTVRCLRHSNTMPSPRAYTHNVCLPNNTYQSLPAALQWPWHACRRCLPPPPSCRPPPTTTPPTGK